MNPYNDYDLQVPAFTPDGYVITNSNGDSVCLHTDGDYKGMEFTEIDFSFMTIRADFSKASFKHCLFNLTDMSESNFCESTFHDCIMTSVAFMWTKSVKLKMTKTRINDLRLFSSNLEQAHFEANFEDVRFTHVNLQGARFVKSNFSDCEVTDSSCTDMTILQTSFDGLKFETCDARWLRVEDSSGDFLKFINSNLAGSTWTSVNSTRGHWAFHSTDFTTARFSMCHAPNSSWTNSNFFGVVMERCNWFNGNLDECLILNSKFESVGWNETTFNNSQIESIEANALRLRFAKFKNCEISDTTIANSLWEFCDFRLVFANNLSIINPSYSVDTKWHSGFTPTSIPNPTPGEYVDDAEEEDICDNFENKNNKKEEKE